MHKCFNHTVPIHCRNCFIIFHTFFCLLKIYFFIFKSVTIYTTSSPFAHLYGLKGNPNTFTTEPVIGWTLDLVDSSFNIEFSVKVEIQAD